MGDIVGLVERASQDLDQAKAERAAKRMVKGEFDLNDLADQFAQMKKMGGMEGLMGFLPGVQKMKKQMAEANVSDKTLDRQAAIISSRTKAERQKPDILQASRKRRIAKGAGRTVQDVNRLLKMHQEMETAMKKIRKMGGLKGLAKMFGGGGMGGLGGPDGAPGGPDLSSLGGLGGNMPKLPPGFQNFMKK